MKKKFVNIALKEDVHRDAKVMAIMKGKTLSKLLEELIEEGLKKRLERYSRE